MEQKFIQDKQGNKQLPITHMNAVRDSQGNTLTSLLGSFEDEVRGLVSTPHQEYVTVATYSALPAEGSEDTIYRVSNYDGSQSQVSAGVYSEYAWNGTQYVFLRVNSAAGEVFDITEYNSNTKYADLAAALGNDGANIPQNLRKGGMSVKFVQSSDNKYIQARCMAQNFTTDVTMWQSSTSEIKAGSKDLVECNGVLQLNWDNNDYTGLRKCTFKNIPTISSGQEPSAASPLFVAKAGIEYEFIFTLAQAVASNFYYLAYTKDGTEIAGTGGTITSGSTTATKRYKPTVDTEMYIGINTFSSVISELELKVVSDEGNMLANVKSWILTEAYVIDNVTRVDDLVTAMDIIWPDGTTGSVSVHTRNSDGLITKMSAVHHNVRYYLYITRNDNGDVISTEISTINK